MTSICLLVVPNSFATISYGAFKDCSALTALVLPDSITTIGVSAFRGCSGLATLILPESVTKIDYLAFAGCTGLSTVIVYRPPPPPFADAGLAPSRISGTLQILVPHGNATGPADNLFGGDGRSEYHVQSCAVPPPHTGLILERTWSTRPTARPTWSRTATTIPRMARMGRGRLEPRCLWRGFPRRFPQSTTRVRLSQWEFSQAGTARHGTAAVWVPGDVSKATPLVDWTNHTGSTAVTYFAGIRKYVMAARSSAPSPPTPIFDGGNFDTWFLESDDIHRAMVVRHLYEGVRAAGQVCELPPPSSAPSKPTRTSRPLMHS